jgi:hypothetical protein
MTIVGWKRRAISRATPAVMPRAPPTMSTTESEVIIGSALPAAGSGAGASRTPHRRPGAHPTSIWRSSDRSSAASSSLALVIAGSRSTTLHPTSGHSAASVLTKPVTAPWLGWNDESVW